MTGASAEEQCLRPNRGLRQTGKQTRRQSLNKIVWGRQSTMTRLIGCKRANEEFFKGP
jgi:hypothetical protein